MSTPSSLSTHLSENIRTAGQLLPLESSFDLIQRHLYLGEAAAYWIGINGFCKTELLQRIFSDLQNPAYTLTSSIDDLVHYMASKIGYAQVSLSQSWEDILHKVLSGPSVLFIDGFAQAIVIDVRTYPARSIEEPDTEKITKGSRDGFVETLLFNANLIRRRVRSPKLTFAMHSIGSKSQTDVAVAYLADIVNRELLDALCSTLSRLRITSLTMGAKSLEELLVQKRWWNPLPSILMTERPDVACSYLLEGHILLLVDNSPMVLVLPGTIFQFTQSPEDYYKNPLTGSYFRLIRFLCIPLSMLILPIFLLLTVSFPEIAGRLHLLPTSSLSPGHLIFYVLAVEWILDLFQYSTSLNSSRYSGSLSIVGGLIIGDIAVSLNWASTEVLFYAAITLLTSLSITNLELSDALRIYRIVLVLATAFGGLWGFCTSLALVLFSMLTTPTFGGFSYFWPLFPFNGKALYTLLFRSPTAKAQPCRVWNRGHVHSK